MRSVSLYSHPKTPCSSLRTLAAHVRRSSAQTVDIQYSLTGDIGKLRVANESAPRRADNLWRHTCFEAFVSIPQNEGYLEFNFAPSSEWAIYQFDSYRYGMQSIDGTPPIIATDCGANNLVVNVVLDLTAISNLRDHAELRLALSAVIEESDGALSYWALKHPPGKPDFHHPDSFALTLNRLKNSQ